MYLKLNFFILIVFICLEVTRQTSIHIPNPFKNIPIPKLLTKYHQFEVAIEYVNTNYNNKSIETKINRMKYLIERVYEILNNLLLSNQKVTINYDKTLFETMDIDLKNINIKAKIIRGDYLAIFHFVDFIEGNKNFSVIFSDKSGHYSRAYEKYRLMIGYLKINYNYNISSEELEEKFVSSIIKEILRGNGFRYNYLRFNHIMNKFDNAPLYLINNLKIYKSHLKYSTLSGFNIINNTNENSDNFYKGFWNFSQYDFHDIMNNYNDSEFTITEFTLNILKEIEQITLPKCDLFEFEQGVEKGFHCLRVSQDCINKKNENEFFLELGLYDEDKIKCYLNDKNNIKNKQCGIKYGNLEYDIFQQYFTPSFKLIKDFQLIGQRPIPELNLYNNQTLKLLKNPPSCKTGTPRTVFFQVPPTIFDEEKNNTNISVLIEELKEINKDVQYYNVTFSEKERNYFVTYETPEDGYIRFGVKKVLDYSGLIRSFSNFYSHNLLLKSIDFKKIKEIGIIPSLQKMYHYGNSYIIDDKDLLYLSFRVYKKTFPNDYNYMPETYPYPEEKEIIFKKFINYSFEEGNIWLIKPKFKSLGIGIHIFHNLTDLPKKYILTKYIEHPHLINNLKYDFRIYVLITGLSPLKIYLYKEGIIRFATEEYSLDINKIDESFIYLTNSYENAKNEDKYKYAKDADTEEGSKWSLKAYKNYCEKNGIDFNKIWEQIIDITIKSIIALKDYIINNIKTLGTNDKNYFSLLGYDFLLDENLKLYLLEINSRPSLLMKGIVDLKLKPQLIADTLNIVGITPYSHDYKDNFKAYDDALEDELIDENQEAAERALCEFGRPRGKFELIFPVKERINYYKKFYKTIFGIEELLWDILER